MVAFESCRLIALAQAAVDARDLVDLEPMDRRILCDQLQQLTHQFAMSGDDRAADRGGL
jgi:hypothetical protein